MEKTSYIYQKTESNIVINKMPVWFEEATTEGDNKNGYISWKTPNQYDEIWGSLGNMNLEYSSLERGKFFHPKEVQRTIDQFNAINVIISKKENDWINSHEFTIWYGTRRKLIRRRYYKENSIHGIFYCDVTERVFSIHAAIIEDHYEGFRPYLLNCFNSIACH